MLAAAVALVALVQAPAQTAGDTLSRDVVHLEESARSPAFAPNGRLAVEVRGDLWITSPTAQPVRVTTGAAWDGDPAWTPDGAALVFASDRAGGTDLWRVGVGPNGATGDPERLTHSAQPNGEPVVAPDGSIVFVRGSGPLADLWVRETDGDERRITTAAGAELSPTLSPDGGRVAYVADREGRRQLRVRVLEDGGETTVVSSLAVEHPAWSPRGDRIAFSTSGARSGVWLTPVEGGYTNLLSEQRAVPAWSADGERIALAEIPGTEPGYNGDPERVGDRDRSDAFPERRRLWSLPAPLAPGAGAQTLTVDAAVERETFNAEAFDRVWSRLAELYYDDSSREEARTAWNALRKEYRPRALAAAGEAELEEVVHAMLRERPTYLAEVSGRAAVSSAHPLATAAGLEMLRQGGNVVDAAVAVSFALGVVEPDASGIGGYGQMLLHLRGMDEPVAIEFLTRVPEAATLSNAALLEDGRLPSDGPVLANVAGTVAGMWRAWEQYGSGEIEWARLLQPAIRYAEQGYVLDDALPTTLAREREGFLKYEGSRRLFFRDGEPLQAGDTLVNPDLAWTLRQIAEHGADAFYRGEVARRVVSDLRARGNVVTMEDLARYYAPERKPVRTTYRGHTVYSSAPATSGGAVLASRLNLLEQFADPRPYTEDAPTLHAMIEAMKLAPSTSGRIADPGLWPVTVEPFESKDTASARWRCFDPAHASGPDPFGSGGPGAAGCVPGRAALDPGSRAGDPHDCAPRPSSVVHPCRSTGTTAFVVGDRDGNFVSVTQTLGTWGGNFYVSPGLGFLYNDKLGSYPSDPAAYGARLPHARNVTIITPTLVFEGTGAERRPLLAVGAAGNAWISAAVYQAVTGVVDQGLGPQRALELPRFLTATERRLDGSREVVVQYEDGFAPDVLETLRGYGHRFQPISLKGELRMGYGSAVLIGDGVARAGADPRRSGAAGAVR